MGLPVKSAEGQKEVGGKHHHKAAKVECRPTIDEILQMDAQTVAQIDPKVLKLEPYRRPAVAQLVVYFHGMTSELKESQRHAFHRGNREEVKRIAKDLKKLKPHVDIINEGHKYTMAQRLRFRKKSEEEVMQEKEEQEKKMQVILDNVSQHPKLEKSFSLSNSFKKFASPISKTLKSTLSLPNGLKGKAITSNGGKRLSESSSHSQSTDVGSSSTPTEGSD
jgi:hypothetical protein